MTLLDQARVAGEHDLGAQSQPFYDARAEALDQHVGTVEQAQDEHAVFCTRVVLCYRALVLARRLNERGGAPVLQGRLAVYLSSRRQEACQLAAAAVLQRQNWLFPTYRDTAVIVARDVDPVRVLTMLCGDRHGGFDPSRTA